MPENVPAKMGDKVLYAERQQEYDAEVTKVWNPDNVDLLVDYKARGITPRLMANRSVSGEVEHEHWRTYPKDSDALAAASLTGERVNQQPVEAPPDKTATQTKDPLESPQVPSPSAQPVAEVKPPTDEPIV